MAIVAGMMTMLMMMILMMGFVLGSGLAGHGDATGGWFTPLVVAFMVKICQMMLAGKNIIMSSCSTCFATKVLQTTLRINFCGLDTVHSLPDVTRGVRDKAPLHFWNSEPTG